MFGVTFCAKMRTHLHAVQARCLNVNSSNFARVDVDDNASPNPSLIWRFELEFRSGYSARQQAISELFTATFAASEGIDEGKTIGDFVRDLMAETSSEDVFAWSAYDEDILCGCIFLSRLTYEQDDRTVFILSPVAVKTSFQKNGIGRKLIAHGLNDLRQKGVDFVVTYGDPNYYSKVGFSQITEKFAKAPLNLSFPEGWLGQSLSGKGERPLVGPSRCVPALNNPDLW